MKYSKAGGEGFSCFHPVRAMTTLEVLLHILYFIQEMSKKETSSLPTTAYSGSNFLIPETCHEWN